MRSSWSNARRSSPTGNHLMDTARCASSPWPRISQGGLCTFVTGPPEWPSVRTISATGSRSSVRGSADQSDTVASATSSRRTVRGRRSRSEPRRNPTNPLRRRRATLVIPNVYHPHHRTSTAATSSIPRRFTVQRHTDSTATTTARLPGYLTATRTTNHPRDRRRRVTERPTDRGSSTHPLRGRARRRPGRQPP